MFKYIFVGLILVWISHLSKAQPASDKMTRERYIETYKELAVKEQARTGIPASITLAQGLLESDNGNSKLARKANNHFGIKCHSDWTGKTFHQDDDAKNECFRKYQSAYDSYMDHSDFLTTKSRYAFLFDFKATDYKAWANGLKKAGYATNPKYPQLLITIIETNKLTQYDKIKAGKINQSEKEENNETSIKKGNKKKYQGADTEDYTLSIRGRQVNINNKIKYITVKEGDSFYGIAKEFEMMLIQLYKYNELGKDASLTPGQKLFLQPKRNKAEFGKDFHTVSKGETMYSISQAYGIKLKKLYQKNNLEEGTEVKEGTRLWLRKRKLPEK